jgi:hypothetical protein
MIKAQQAIFIEQIKLRSFDDGYVDRQEEQELMAQALLLAIPIEEAQALLQAFCQEQKLPLESAIEQHVEKFLQHFVENEGSIRQKIFEDAALLYMQESQRRLNLFVCRQKVKSLLLQRLWPVKQDFLNRWFDKIES